MSLIAMLGMALALAVDAFAVSVASGIQLKKVRMDQYARMAITFGLFQFTMPILGWFLGSGLHNFIELWDHWVAFVLLALIGLNMLRESLTKDEDCQSVPTKDPTRGFSLFLLGLATSIDALAVGLSLAMLGADIRLPVLLIGVMAFLLSLLGLYLGQTLSRAKLIGKRAELAGGLVLIAIGLNILVEHGVLRA